MRKLYLEFIQDVKKYNFLYCKNQKCISNINCHELSKKDHSFLYWKSGLIEINIQSQSSLKIVAPHVRINFSTAVQSMLKSR